ncbi:hypothetical protein GGS23DRAFT_561414 [Durotheca rogersii]|uniref:uncharacterized protein n=1 Tax=Durotheca rogersii TaxID=419775 RepID=UPI00222014B3|nr:uncharacterized protein GGS23DRAFT_561414 [Durotheca rogersii]KAI5864689.1 hypothetical protein GGS23DRAFT_561414 [Durotheca rogersii]
MYTLGSNPPRLFRMASDEGILRVEKALGYSFRVKDYLKQALVAAGADPMWPDGNRRLAQVGITVIDLVSLQRSFREGASRASSQAFRTVQNSLKSLAAIAARMGIQDYITYSTRSGANAPSVLAKSVSALIGAVFMDSFDMKEVDQMIQRLTATQNRCNDTLVSPTLDVTVHFPASHRQGSRTSGTTQLELGFSQSDNYNAYDGGGSRAEPSENGLGAFSQGSYDFQGNPSIGIRHSANNSYSQQPRLPHLQNNYPGRLFAADHSDRSSTAAAEHRYDNPPDQMGGLEPAIQGEGDTREADSARAQVPPSEEQNPRVLSIVAAQPLLGSASISPRRNSSERSQAMAQHLFSASSVLGLRRIIRSWREKGTALPPLLATSVLERLQAIATLDQKIAFFQLLRRYQILRLYEDVGGHTTGTASREVVMTSASFTLEKQKPGNPLLLAEAETTKLMMRQMGLSVSPQSPGYRGTYNNMSRLRRLGRRLHLMVRRFDIGILALLDLNSENGEFGNADARILQLSDSEFQEGISLVDLSQSEHPHRIARTAARIVNALIREDPARVPPFRIELATPEQIIKTAGSEQLSDLFDDEWRASPDATSVVHTWTSSSSPPTLG